MIAPANPATVCYLTNQLEQTNCRRGALPTIVVSLIDRPQNKNSTVPNLRK